jgi:lysophospholipase L1-like esterase
VGARLAGIAPAHPPDATGSWAVYSNLKDHRMQGLAEPHQFRISTNADGLRTEAERHPEGNTYRVAIMGDSTVFGWGVQDHETIAATANAALVDMGRPEIEVINAGQPGYSTGMVGWLFKSTVAAYTPDLTIVFISMHDFNRTLISDVERHLGPANLKASARSILVRHISLYGWLRQHIYPMAHAAQLLPDVRTKETRVPRVSDTERDLVLRTMTTTAQQWGGKIAIGFVPFHRDLVNADPRFSDVRPGLKHAKAWSEAHGVPLYDLRRCCGPGADERTFAFDRGHLNALGNAEVGVALTAAIAAHSISQVQ